MTSSWFVDVSLAKWLGHVLTVVVVCPTSLSGAACSVDQMSACKSAALSGQLDEYRASGQCMVKQYVQYTHVCTVTDYLPSIDHCCCFINDATLLCCRYRQHWYHFRCMEVEDQVQLKAGNSLTHWRFLLPVILCPVAFIVLLIFLYCCCFRRRRARPEPDMTSSNICWPCMVVSGVGNKTRHVTGNNVTPRTCVEPSAPSMTSSPDCGVARHVTCGPETVTAPLCHRCGAAVTSCDNALPPPSYEMSQQLQGVNQPT